MSYAPEAKARRAGNDDDALFVRVINLPQARLSHLFERFVGHPDVTAAGWHVSERRLSRRPKAERDEEWTSLHDDGLSYAEIACAYSTTRSTVAKAVQRFRQRVDTDSLSTAEGGYHFYGGRENV